MLVKLGIPIITSLLGYILSRRSLVSETWLKYINQSISYLLLPCVIIPAMANITISRSLIKLPLATFVIVFSLFLIAAIYAGIKKMPTLEKGSFLTAFCSLEGGSVGVALILLIYGDKALSDFVIFDITHAVILFTFTYFIACFYGTKHHISWKFLSGFFIGPIPFAVVLGLFIHFAFGGINLHLGMILKGIGCFILPVVTFVLGYRFVYFPNHLFSSVITLVAKMIVGFFIALGFVSFFHVEGYEKMVILLAASLPPSFLVLVFAEEQGLAKEFLVTLLPIGIIVSFCVLYFAYSMWGGYVP